MQKTLLDTINVLVFCNNNFYLKCRFHKLKKSGRPSFFAVWSSFFLSICKYDCNVFNPFWCPFVCSFLFVHCFAPMDSLSLLKCFTWVESILFKSLVAAALQPALRQTSSWIKLCQRKKDKQYSLIQQKLVLVFYGF